MASSDVVPNGIAGASAAVAAAVGVACLVITIVVFRVTGLSDRWTYIFDGAALVVGVVLRLWSPNVWVRRGGLGLAVGAVLSFLVVRLLISGLGQIG